MVVAAPEALAVLIGAAADGGGLRQVAAASNRLHVIGGAHAARDASGFSRLAVFVRATRLDEVAPLVSAANRANRLRALIIDSDIDAEWIPYMIERARLRILRNVLVHHGPSVPLRFLRAWSLGIEDQAIAGAAIFQESLVVRNCAMKSVEIRFDAYPALAAIPPPERGNFTIETDGIFLHWPSADVHLTMEDVLLAADPVLRARARARRLADEQAFGTAVRALRTEHGLTQAAIPGLSPRHLRRIEQGFVPGDDALARLAAAHGMDPDAYLEAVCERME